jgi:hypothetical protein
MTPIQILGLVLFFVLLLATASFALRWLLLRSRTQQRWAMLSEAPSGTSTDADTLVQLDGRWWLARWIYLAGYRQPRADLIFLTATGLCLGFGLILALGMQFSGLQAAMERTVVLVPGGVGETFLPVVWVAPWLLLIMLTSVPWLIVRRARRERV